MKNETRTGWAGLIAFVLAYPFAAASGLLIAPLMAAMALLAMPLHRSAWTFREIPWPVIPGGLFLIWVGISFLWSPHDDPQQIPKLVLGVPLYILFALRVGGLEGAWKARVETAVIFAVLALGLVLLSETLTDGAATRSFKTTVEDASALDAESIRRHVSRSLGHAAAPLVLLAGPAALIAWREGGPLIGGIILFLAGIAAFSFGTEVNAVAFILAIIASIFAAFWPRMAIATLFGLVAGAFVIAPLVLPGLVAAMPESWSQSLPLSWVWRLEIWSYAGSLLEEKLWFGHGLDASRPLNEQMELAGYQIERLPLHPHNAPIQIWLETGLVGAILLAYTLIAAGSRIAIAARLSRIQAIAVSWVFTVYVSLIFFSYGVWQEWHQAAVALAATTVLFLGAKRSAA